MVVINDFMETSLETARNLRERMDDGDALDGDDWGWNISEALERALQDLQVSAMIGPYGITSPPLRAQCLPTLLEPGSECPRQECHHEEKGCPGNTYEVCTSCTMILEYKALVSDLLLYEVLESNRLMSDASDPP